MPGSYIFLFCLASLGRILSETKANRRHIEREIQMLMVYQEVWRRTTADASYQTWMFTYLFNPAIYGKPKTKPV